MKKKSAKKATPANRRKTGVRKLRGGLDPSIGKQTRFKPGKSGNPDGRPKRLLSEAYRELLGQVHPADPQKRTYAELIAEAQAREAIRGETVAAKEIADRTEGKAAQHLEVSGPDDGAVPITLNVRFIDANEDQPTKA